MSVSAWRPVLETSCSASAARSGFEAWAAAAASARVTITWMLCETTSCISRAMRARSAAAASDACWSRSSSRRWARSASQSSWLRSARTTTPARSAAKARPVMKTRDLKLEPVGVQCTVAITTPVSRMTHAARTRTHSHSTATVYMATSSDESASAGPVTSHWTNATTEMARKTAMGARRRKTRGAVRAATSHRLGVVRPAPESTNQPEHSTNSTTARATSTAVA